MTNSASPIFQNRQTQESKKHYLISMKFIWMFSKRNFTSR